MVQQERDDVKRGYIKQSSGGSQFTLTNVVIDRIGFVLFAPLLTKKECRYFKQAGFRKKYYNFTSAQAK